MTSSLEQVGYVFRLQGRDGDPDSVLQTAAYGEIASGVVLMADYLATFVTAETAVLLMAIRAYMQDILRLSDEEVLRVEG